jgi:hypothetical protein
VPVRLEHDPGVIGGSVLVCHLRSSSQPTSTG